LKDPVNTCDPELKRVCSTKVQDGSHDCVDKMIKHYSTWFGFLLERSKRRKKGLSVTLEKPKSLDPIGMNDMCKAECAIIKYAQSVYSSEMSKDGKVKLQPSIANLDPFIDQDEILKVGGRLLRANLPHNAKHQVILPKDSHISRLILDQIHSDVGHSGRNYMLSRLRETYWIVNANSAIRKLIGR
jgi:hypothetical protein